MKGKGKADESQQLLSLSASIDENQRWRSLRGSLVGGAYGSNAAVCLDTGLGVGYGNLDSDPPINDCSRLGK